MAETRHAILKADRTLSEIVRRLAQAYEPDCIYLFGSRARGDFRPESAYDLLVVVPDDASSDRRQDRLASEALRGFRVATSVLINPRSYFEARRNLKASLPGTILREGMLLYGAEEHPKMTDGGTAKIQDTKEWMRKAEEDLRVADYLLADAPPFLGMTLFHCQQAAEKALKAFLACHDEPFAKPHKIGDIGVACLRFDPTLTDFGARAASLTDYAWKFRYPGGGPLPSVEATRDSVEIARQLFQAVLVRVPAECKPDLA
jgi:predicted nucleotidyltransferase/HEPN domain-containing protein